MPLTIPLKLAPSAPAIHKSDGLKLRLPVLGSSSSVSASRDQQDALKAVGVATALYDAKKSLALATLVEKKPEEGMAPALKEENLGKILSNVADVKSGNAETPEISKSVRAAAKSAGAKPELVAAAYQTIVADPDTAKRTVLATEARQWVAAVQPEILAKAARFNSKVTQLALVPTRASQNDVLGERMASLEESVDCLKTEQDEIVGRVAALEDQRSQGANTKS